MIEVKYENVETAEEIALQAAQIEAWHSFWSEVLSEKDTHAETEQQPDTN